MKTVKEIAEHVRNAKSLKSADLAPMYEYMRAKEDKGLPIVLEDEIIAAAERCQKAADDVADFLQRAEADLRVTRSRLEADGVRADVRSSWLTIARVNVNDLAQRVIDTRENLFVLLRAWVSVADRVALTDADREAAEKRAQERAEQRRAAQIAAWCKRSKRDLHEIAASHGIHENGTKEAVAAALVDAGVTC